MKKIKYLLVVLIILLATNITIAKQPLDFQIENKDKLQDYMNKVIDMNSKSAKFKNGEIEYWVQWINIDHLVMSTYHYGIRKEYSDLSAEFFAEKLYDAIIYTEDGNMLRDYLVINLKIFDRKPKNDTYPVYDKSEVKKSISIMHRGLDIVPDYTKKIDPIIKYSDKLVNEYMIYFKKERIAEVFTDAERVNIKNPNLVVRVYPQIIDDENMYSKRFVKIPLREDVAEIKKVRNKSLAKLNTLYHNGDLVGERQFEYIYKPYRKIILPKKIKKYNEYKDNLIKQYKKGFYKNNN